jgi:hypothetical protein
MTVGRSDELERAWKEAVVRYSNAAVLNVGYAVRAQKSLYLVIKSLSWLITQ